MIPAGIAAHAGSPETRWLNRPTPPEQPTLPLRWPSPSHSSTTVTNQRGARRDRDLVQRGAARGLGRRARRTWRPNVSSFDVTLCDVTPETVRSDDVLTIDELARETGLTVRNVRSHHARGLLPPPEVRGRTGYYGPEHVERLRLIQELQAEGLKLDGIKRLLGDSGERLLALKRAARRGGGDARGGHRRRSSASACGLRERRPAPADRQGRRSSACCAPLGDGHFEVPSPALLAAAEEVVAPRRRARPRARHDRERRRATRARSRASSSSSSWTTSSSRSPTRACPRSAGASWPDSIQHVRPLAAQALLAVFRRTMDEEVEATFADLDAPPGRRSR